MINKKIIILETRYENNVNLGEFGSSTVGHNKPKKGAAGYSLPLQYNDVHKLELSWLGGGPDK